jgi:CheY-like chemotaxis protein
VLVVEDDILVAMLAEEQLRELGFDPVSVMTGAQALIALAGGGFALAVIDLGLPDMRGDELTARARRIAPHLPIVIASGYDRGELHSRFDGDPDLTVLAKPYIEADLRAAIASLGVAGA